MSIKMSEEGQFSVKCVCALKCQKLQTPPRSGLITSCNGEIATKRSPSKWF